MLTLMKLNCLSFSTCMSTCIHINLLTTSTTYWHSHRFMCPASLARVMIAIRLTLAAVSCATMFLEGGLRLCFFCYLVLVKGHTAFFLKHDACCSW